MAQAAPPDLLFWGTSLFGDVLCSSAQLVSWARPMERGTQLSSLMPGEAVQPDSTVKC